MLVLYIYIIYYIYLHCIYIYTYCINIYIYMGKLYNSLTWKSETCGYLGDSPNPNHDCSEGEQWGRYNILPRSIVDYGPMMTNEGQDICPETGSNQSWRLRSLSWGTRKKRAPLRFKPLSQTRNHRHHRHLRDLRESLSAAKGLLGIPAIPTNMTTAKALITPRPTMRKGWPRVLWRQSPVSKRLLG